MSAHIVQDSILVRKMHTDHLSNNFWSNKKKEKIHTGAAGVGSIFTTYDSGKRPSWPLEFRPSNQPPSIPCKKKKKNETMTNKISPKVGLKTGLIQSSKKKETWVFKKKWNYDL